ncbi:MAG: Clp protease N-terminal domain-containing protein [Acidimicrobiia bacterium]
MHDRLLQRARTWAVRLGHNYVGCEHLLLVLVEDGQLAVYGVTTDDVVREIRTQVTNWVSEADALRAVGLDPTTIKQTAHDAFGSEVRIQGLDRYPFLSLTPRANQVLEYASTDDDVLYVLLREDANLGVLILERLGVPVEQLAESLRSTG